MELESKINIKYLLNNNIKNYIYYNKFENII